MHPIKVRIAIRADEIGCIHDFLMHKAPQLLHIPWRNAFWEQDTAGRNLVRNPDLHVKDTMFAHWWWWRTPCSHIDDSGGQRDSVGPLSHIGRGKYIVIVLMCIPYAGASSLTRHTYKPPSTHYTGHAHYYCSHNNEGYTQQLKKCTLEKRRLDGWHSFVVCTSMEHWLGSHMPHHVPLVWNFFGGKSTIPYGALQMASKWQSATQWHYYAIIQWIDVIVTLLYTS